MSTKDEDMAATIMSLCVLLGLLIGLALAIALRPRPLDIPAKLSLTTSAHSVLDMSYMECAVTMKPSALPLECDRVAFTQNLAICVARCDTLKKPD